MKRIIALIISLTLCISLSIPVSAITTVLIKSIQVDNTKVNVIAGETYQLIVKLSPVNTTQKNLTFVTGNKSIATVDSKGKIKGLKAGTTVVTATSTANKKILVKCSVTVLGQPAWKTKQVKLVMWDYPKEGPDKQTALDNFKKFDDAYPNIKVEHKLYQPEPGKDRIEFTTAMAGGNGPDMYAGTPFVTMKQWIAQGFFEPLNNYMATWKETPYLQSAGLKIATVNNLIYGIPNLFTPFVLAYRVDKFKEAGLDPSKPPKTWAEYVKAAVALTDESKGQYGISLMGSAIADWWFQFYVWQAGGDITTVQNDGTIKLRITEKPAIQALQFYKDLKWKNNVVQKNLLMEFTDQAKDFATGKAGMIIFTPEWLPWWAGMGLKQEDMAIAPMPAGPAGVGTVSVSGGFDTINATISKDKKDAAWEYIKFDLRRENQIKKFKDMAAAGVKYPTTPIYTDLNIGDYIKDIPQSWITAMNQAAKSSREEYVLVEDIRPYLTKAIQTILVDKNADPKTELEKAAVLINKEVIEKYNSSIKK